MRPAFLILPLALAAPAMAHHSFAMFDYTHPMTIDGTVKSFSWVNPHSTLWVVRSVNGADEEWSIELTSPGNLTRAGWTKRSVAPGDHVQIEISPLRDGQHGGAFKKGLLVATGKQLPVP